MVAKDRKAWHEFLRAYVPMKDEKKKKKKEPLEGVLSIWC